LPVPTLYLDASFANLQSARVDGVEAVLEWAPIGWMRLEAQGNWMNTRASGYITGPVDPEESYSLRARLDLPRDVELDLSWRSVDELAGEGLIIGGYDSLNLRAGWTPMEGLEFSLSIDNLLDNEHFEFWDDLSFAPGVTVGRTYFVRVNWSLAR
jgi:outer membrane receptor protein involved in Fe transport